jgi:hypothetical protein
MRSKFLITAFILLPYLAFCQIIDQLGQSPSKLKWKQIQTPHFRIVFPIEIEKDAQRTANALMNAYSDVAKSLGILPRRMPIVMQNQTTDNNAFVTSEGRRAEFFSTPPQNPNDMGMNNWFDELSLHEYRHVVQQDQSIVGWGKYMFYIFGNSGTSIMQGLTNPWWFWEGDAVGCESAMGYGGRGRIPSFDLTFRTQLLSRGAFSFMKASCGSMKNAIPNHYLLGYLMTTYDKNHFGADVWEKILTRTYTKPPLPFSFSRSMKKVTGMNANETYNAMTAELKELWGKQLENVKETPVENFQHTKEKVFVNYKFPQYLPDGDIVAEKAGLETGSFLAYKSSIVDQSQFVLLSKDGKETKLRISGVLDDNGMLSSAAGKVVWSEFGYDPRWGAKNFTVIKILDVETKKIRQLTHRTRLHAPCLSPDGKIIAAIDYTTALKYNVVLLDAMTGKTIRRFDNPDNNQYLQPHFTQDGRAILMVQAEPGFKKIVKLDIATGHIQQILKPIPDNISAPVDYKNFVLYNSPQSGIDNVYAVDTATGIQYQVTDRKFGAFNPCVSPDGSHITFQDFMADGFRVVTTPLIEKEWKKVDLPEEHTEKVEYYKPFAKQEAGNILAHIPDSVYPTSPYKRLKNAVMVYSWGIEPLSNLPDLLSIGIKSQDLLSTTVLEAGFRYDNNEKHWGKYVKLSYDGLYPEFFFSYEDGKRKAIFAKGETDTTSAPPFHYDLIRFRNVNVGVGLPLNLSGGAFIRKVNVTSQVIYNSFDKLTRHTSDNKYDRSYFGNFYSLQQDVSLEIRLRQSIRDVAPRLGTLIQFTFRNAPFHSYFLASQTALDATLFIPGFFKHHSIILRSYWQKDDSSNYHFENRFNFVRNTTNQLFQHFQLWSIDYKMPVAYPDFSFLNGALYFQRIKLDLFSEWATGKSVYNDLVDGHIRHYTNLGIELTSDVNFMRFLIPFEAGIRSSYLVQDRSVHHQLIVKVPIF